jgi:hypothetical protein
MTEGAFALVDCLGFKGIWNRTNAEQVVTTLKAIEQGSKGWIASALVQALVPHKFVVTTSFISDTIAISVVPRVGVSLSEWEKGYLITLAGMSCAEATKHFAAIPCALRGCITYGEHMVDANFIIGKAVDQAASLHEQAQGAFIWLSPEAGRRHEIYTRFLRTELWNQIPPENFDKMMQATLEVILRMAPSSFASAARKFFESQNESPATQEKKSKFLRRTMERSSRYDWALSYPTPMKGGDTLVAPVVNPFAAVWSQDVPTMAKQLISAFDESSLDVIVKRQNTERFIDASARIRHEAVADANQYVKAVATEIFGAEYPWPTLTESVAPKL